MQRKSAAEIQRDLDFMRAMYAQRRSMNHCRHQAAVGYSLLAVAIGLPVLIVIGILI